MKDIRIGIVGNVSLDARDFLYSRLLLDKQEYNIIIETEKPDYLFCIISHIIYFPNIKREFEKLYSEDKIIIFYGDEAITPDLNVFDYAITYDYSLSFGDRICWRPNLYFVRGGKNVLKGNSLALVEDSVVKEMINKRRFCNFIYSNAKANKMRDSLFESISKIDKVDSLGEHLNNSNVKPTRNSKDWFEISVKMKENYKFSIAAENVDFYGYTSEKIMSSFLAHSIPIYWGNEYVKNEFNPKAFVNCNGKTMQDIIKEISEIANDVDKMVDMMKEPWVTSEQISEQERRLIQYKEFCQHIFDQGISDAKRTPTGGAVSEYRKNIYSV